MERDLGPIESAAVVLRCPTLPDSVEFFTSLGFRVEVVQPADDPAVVVVVGHGVRLRLEREAAGATAAAGCLRLACHDPAAVAGGATELTAPDGTRVLLAPADPPVELPASQPGRILARARDAAWITGRAGMRYRDLRPGAVDGRVGASHIQILDDGPVPDYVHYHRLHLQMIYCWRGRVRVVYEDQGDPFWLQAGDCVLQPPRIRHRVLECRDACEVIEVSAPASHETRADLEMTLPSASVHTDRWFGGQQFVRHQAQQSPWTPWSGGGVARDLGLGAASGSRVVAHVIRPGATPEPAPDTEPAELRTLYALAGRVTLGLADGDVVLEEGDCLSLPGDEALRLRRATDHAELLHVALRPEGTGRRAR